MWPFNQAKNLVIGFCCKKLHKEKFLGVLTNQRHLSWNAPLNKLPAWGIILLIIFFNDYCLCFLSDSSIGSIILCRNSLLTSQIISESFIYQVFSGEYKASVIYSNISLLMRYVFSKVVFFYCIFINHHCYYVLLVLDFFLINEVCRKSSVSLKIFHSLITSEFKMMLTFRNTCC